MCISEYMQTTFFYLERFLKKLADDQCSLITKSSIYHIKHMCIYHFTIGVHGLTWNWVFNESIYYVKYFAHTACLLSMAQLQPCLSSLFIQAEAWSKLCNESSDIFQRYIPIDWISLKISLIKVKTYNQKNICKYSQHIIHTFNIWWYHIFHYTTHWNKKKHDDTILPAGSQHFHSFDQCQVKHHSEHSSIHQEFISS